MKYSEFNKKYADLELQYTDSEVYIYCDGVMVGKVSKEYRYRMSTHYDGFEQFPAGYAANLLMNMNMLAETPPEEREEEKRYRVKFPGIKRDGRNVYLMRQSNADGTHGFDWSPEEYIFDDFPDGYLFTEKEIKSINEHYWHFAEEDEEGE